MADLSRMNLDMDGQEIMERMTLNVKLHGMKIFWIRFKLMCFFLKLGAKLGGIGIQIEDRTDAN